MPELALIWSNQQRAWWRPNQQGYTGVIEWAGRYPLAEAQRIVDGCNQYTTTPVSDSIGLNPARQVPNEVLVRVVVDLEPLAGDGTGAVLPAFDGTVERIHPGLLAAERERIAQAIETYAEGVEHPVFCPPDIAYAVAIETAARIARKDPGDA